MSARRGRPSDNTVALFKCLAWVVAAMILLAIVSWAVQS